MIALKSPSELARMRRAGRIVAEVLAALQQRVRPGVNTAELDELAYQIITKHKAIPSLTKVIVASRPLYASRSMRRSCMTFLTKSGT
jgi:methionine aminopeptidase